MSTPSFEDVSEPLLLLGRGAFGEVSLVQVSEAKGAGSSGAHLALKRVRCQISDVGIRKAMLEAQLLWQLSQDNAGILRCYDFRVLSEPAPTLELLLEFAPMGDLCRRLRACKEVSSDLGLPRAEVLSYTADVAEGLSFLHGLRPKIFHRDVKPPNIMLCYPDGERLTPRAKLADFGVAKVMESEASTAGTATFIGTPHYLSPEIFAGGTYDERADAWALGCVLYEMMCFRRPFHFAEDNVAVMALRISHGTYDTELLSKQASNYPEGLLQIAAGLLRLELSGRLRAVDVLSSLDSITADPGLDSDPKRSDLPSCWDPIPLCKAVSDEVGPGLSPGKLDTDSWHGAEVQSDSDATHQLLAVLEANESPYTLGHLTDPIYGEVLTLPAVDGSRLGGLDVLEEQYGPPMLCLSSVAGVTGSDDLPH
eukprot:s1169_g17.t1